MGGPRRFEIPSCWISTEEIDRDNEIASVPE
jgi:hypothetical protein